MLRPHILLTLSLSLLLAFQPTSADQPDLVIELFRHGARGPVNQTFDPAQDWGETLGQLTPAGMRMHYLLGAAIKDRYKDLLKSYNADEIYVRSTDFNRTIMSAYSHMYGVYGETGPDLGAAPASVAIPPFASPLIQEMVAQMSTEESALPNSLQVVPVHVVPLADDNVLVPFVACPKADQWLNENGENEKATDVFVNELNAVTSYLQSKGLQIETFADLDVAADNAIANKVEQKALPGNIDPNSEYYQDLKFAFEWYTTNAVAGSEQQVTLYPIDPLNAIAGYLDGSITGQSKLKFAFLSAHDTTLITLLNAFNITTTDCLLANYRSQKLNKEAPYPACKYPQFASDLIFEFYNTSQPYIKFYYDGVAVPICGNKDNICTYRQFLTYIKAVTKHHTSEDYRKRCEFPETVLTASVHKLQILVGILTGVCLICIAGLVFVIAKKGGPQSKKDGDNTKWITLDEEKEQPKMYTKDGSKIELANQYGLRT